MPYVGDDILLADIFNLQDWTPSWTNVTTGGSSVNEGWYATLGKLTFFGGRLQFGTAPSISTYALLTLPVAAWTGGGNSLQLCIGSWNFRDSSAGDHFSGAMGIWSSAGTSVSFGGAWRGSAPDRRITTAIPATVAVDDILSFQGVYRAA